jgi:hypothetical protein
MDLDHTHARLMAALQGIAEGKGRRDSVSVQFGQTTRIFEALNDAAKYLHEPFHEEDLELVDRAFAKLGRRRVSNKRSEVASEILAILVPS